MFGLFENTGFLPSQLQWTCCFLQDLTVCNRINWQKKRNHFSQCVAFFFFLEQNPGLGGTNKRKPERSHFHGCHAKSSGSRRRWQRLAKTLSRPEQGILRAIMSLPSDCGRWDEKNVREGGTRGANPHRGVVFQDPFYGALWGAYTACCPSFSGRTAPIGCPRHSGVRPGLWMTESMGWDQHCHRSLSICPPNFPRSYIMAVGVWWWW